MTKALELIDEKFHMLKVIERAENDSKKRSMWLCKCDCGNEKIVRGRELITGDTTSCGCVHNMISRIKYFSKNPILEWTFENFKIEKIICRGNRKNCMCTCLKCNFIKYERPDRLNNLKKHICYEL